MDDKTIPYIAFEITQAKHERTVRRLIMAIVIAVAMIFASNAVWLVAWLQYDYSGEEQIIELDSRHGNANYIGNSGGIINGSNNGN